MTDERMGDALWRAVRQLPPGSGIIFRHHATDPATRRAMFARLSAIARRRKLVLVRAGPEKLGRGEDGQHGRHMARGQGIRSWPAHDLAEIAAARRAGADVIFLSAIFATRSHPGSRPLGTLRAIALARHAGRPVIALGGVNVKNFARLGPAFHGWAGIDAWL